MYINDTIYTMSSFPYSMSTDVIVASDLYNVSQQLNKSALNFVCTEQIIARTIDKW